jgi:hypothetical protein
MRTVVLDTIPDEQEDRKPWLLLTVAALLLLLVGGAIGYALSQGGVLA